jgi:uncharacterized protein (DUF2384 family)
MQIDDKKYAELVAAKEKLDKAKAINQRSYERRVVRTRLMLKKAEQAKITVTEAEVDQELKRLKGLK